MHSNTYAFLFTAAAALVSAQSSQVNQPLTTNNAQSACVEFGDCTQNPDNTFATATQLAPVTAPASSNALPPPTNAAQSEAFISSLAKAGGSAAFSSRVANGQPTGVNQPDGATQALTATVIALPPPTSSSSASGTGSNQSGASIGPLKISWTSLAAPALVAIFGAAFIL